MSNESKPSGSERLAQVLGEVDMDELEKAIKARMETIKKAGGFHESVDGPDDEMKYILHKDGLPSDRYHELARTITEAKQTVGSTRTSFLTFSSSRLDEEVFLSLANNAEITAEDIYGVLVGACADRTSVSTLCASSQNSPAGNTVLYHLRTKFEPEQLERVITAAPAKGSR